MGFGGRHLPNGFVGQAELTKRRPLTVRDHQRHDRRGRRRGAWSVQPGVADTAEERFLGRSLNEEQPKVVVSSHPSRPLVAPLPTVRRQMI